MTARRGEQGPCSSKDCRPDTGRRSSLLACGGARAPPPRSSACPAPAPAAPVGPAEKGCGRLRLSWLLCPQQRPRAGPGQRPARWPRACGIPRFLSGTRSGLPLFRCSDSRYGEKAGWLVFIFRSPPGQDLHVTRCPSGSLWLRLRLAAPQEVREPVVGPPPRVLSHPRGRCQRGISTARRPGTGRTCSSSPSWVAWLPTFSPLARPEAQSFWHLPSRLLSSPHHHPAPGI